VDELFVTIQMKTAGQDRSCAAVYFAVLTLRQWLKSQSVTIQMKATRKTFLSSIRALKSSSVTV